MRLQLSRPENHFLDPDLYNEIFTMHGTTMMFLFAVPVMQGLGIYFVPLMVGADTIAFPRLVGVQLLDVPVRRDFPVHGLRAERRAGCRLVQLSATGRSRIFATKRADVWAQLITFTEVASLAVAVSLITTAFKLRTPGMALNRIPAFVWAEIVTSFMVIFAMPAVMIASTALILDRLVHTHFFDSARGGDPLLWQHLFWFFGHPEVYIIFIPGAGLVSTIVPVAARRPLMGYVVVVLSLAATAFMRLRAVGPPHVCDRAATARRKLFYRRQHHDRDSLRRAGLLLDRHDVERPCVADDPDALGPRLLLHLHHGRHDRSHGRVSAD